MGSCDTCSIFRSVVFLYRIFIALYVGSDRTMTDRQICSKESPMPKDAQGLWQHPDAKMIDTDYGGVSDGGSYEKYLCPICGLRFWVTLPD